jgi:hypothetical protein
MQAAPTAAYPIQSHRLDRLMHRGHKKVGKGKAQEKEQELSGNASRHGPDSRAEFAKPNSQTKEGALNYRMLARQTLAE